MPLFPLRMTSIEKFHLFDDSADFPNQFFGRIHVDGPLDPSRVTRAFEVASRRHVWGDVKASLVRGRWQWVRVPDLAPELWIVDREPASYPPIDPTRSCPARFVVVVGEERSSATVQAHHAMADGLGGMHFLNDWMVIYDNLVGGRDPEEGLPVLQPDRLRNRSALRLTSWRYLKHLWKQPLALFGAGKFLFRRFRTLGSQRDETLQGNPPAGFPAIESVVLPRDSLIALRARLVQCGVSLNDYLAATLFRALADWEPTAGDRRCLRMIIPISIRERSDAAMPAANRTTLVQIDRFQQETADPVGLAKGIHFELGLIRKWYLDRIFLIVIRLMSVSNYWLQRTASRRQPRATTLFTNLGKPFLKTGLPHRERRLQMGGVTVRAIELAAPIRSHLPISFTALQYAGELQLTGHVDTRFLDAEAARSLLASWVQLLETPQAS